VKEITAVTAAERLAARLLAVVVVVLVQLVVTVQVQRVALVVQERLRVLAVRQ
jgi:hypothetical protein